MRYQPPYLSQQYANNQRKEQIERPRVHPGIYPYSFKGQQVVVIETPKRFVTFISYWSYRQRETVPFRYKCLSPRFMYGDILPIQGNSCVFLLFICKLLTTRLLWFENLIVIKHRI